MDGWGKLKDLVGKSAPLLGGALGGPMGAIIGQMISSALGVANTPDAVEQALLASPENALKLIELQNTHEVALQKLLVEKEANKLNNETSQQAAINQTMQVEYQTNDRFKTSWRPLFGYTVAISWGVQTIGLFFAITYVVIFEPQLADDVLKAVSSLMEVMVTPWGIALSVLGINIRERTKERAIEMGGKPISIFDAIAQRISK